MTYRYPHFHTRLLAEDMRFQAGPRPGEDMPDFDLPTVDGGRVTKSDFTGRTPLLLTMGSVTCPMTAAADPALKRLHAEFGDRVAFMTLYVREAHPGERYPQPDRIERKTEHARDLKERDELPWPVAVDDLDGTLHRRLDPKPNAAYLMDADGRVFFRVLWSDDRESVLRTALENVLSGRSQPREHQGHVVPMLRGVAEMDRMLTLSGPTARRDVRKAAPPMYAMARVMGLMKHRRGHVPA
ncbi:deiodinase-like protein [Streptomyces sp. NPDC006996]|uniref:TlpA family protein disulfide reductase n=1 Tax=Streptomyces sp. NPDC006996 TaxID=3156908 RepID=UPI0033EBF74B